MTLDNAGNTLSTARRINLTSTTQTFTDFVGASDLNDFYSFSLNSRSSFNLTLNGLSRDADVQLLDGVGNIITSSTASGISNELINRQLDTGSYFIRVFPFSAANTNYNLNVAATPVTPVSVGDNTLSTARQINVGSTTTTFTDWVGTADTNDYYRFTLNQNSNLNLTLNGLSGDADVQLLDGAGNFITSSRASGTSSELINRQLDTGSYFIRVFPMTGVNTNYNLNVAATPVTPVGVGDNTLSTARQINVGSTTTTFTDWVGTANTNDYYRFTLNQNSNLNLTLNGLSGDADVQLLDGTGNIITSSTASGISNELINRQLNTGSYFIRVYPMTGVNTNYNLNVAATPVTPVGVGDNTLSTARQINVGSTTTTFTDWVGTTDTNDYYRFTLNQNSNLNLTLNGLSADADVQLLDGTGNIITSSTASGISNDFINRQLNSGSYFIRVYPMTGVNTNYNLNVAATPVSVGDNTLSTARQINVGSTRTTFTDWVGTTDTNDYYRFTLNQNSNFNLTLNGLSADADVQLLDGVGNIITSSRASGISNELINRQLNAGSYFIRVYPMSGVNTNYNLSVAATANSTSFINSASELPTFLV